jgi:hypothetical protein
MKHSDLSKSGKRSAIRFRLSKSIHECEIYIFITSQFCRSYTYIQKELSEVQKKKVEMLADKVLDLNIMEMRYFNETSR